MPRSLSKPGEGGNFSLVLCWSVSSHTKQTITGKPWPTSHQYLEVWATFLLTQSVQWRIALEYLTSPFGLHDLWFCPSYNQRWQPGAVAPSRSYVTTTILCLPIDGLWDLACHFTAGPRDLIISTLDLKHTSSFQGDPTPIPPPGSVTSKIGLQTTPRQALSSSLLSTKRAIFRSTSGIWEAGLDWHCTFLRLAQNSARNPEHLAHCCAPKPGSQPPCCSQHWFVSLCCCVFILVLPLEQNLSCLLIRAVNCSALLQAGASRQLQILAHLEPLPPRPTAEGFPPSVPSFKHSMAFLHPPFQGIRILTFPECLLMPRFQVFFFLYVDSFVHLLRLSLQSLLLNHGKDSVLFLMWQRQHKEPEQSSLRREEFILAHGLRVCSIRHGSLVVRGWGRKMNVGVQLAFLFSSGSQPLESGCYHLRVWIRFDVPANYKWRAGEISGIAKSSGEYLYQVKSFIILNRVATVE